MTSNAPQEQNELVQKWMVSDLSKTVFARTHGGKVGKVNSSEGKRVAYVKAKRIYEMTTIVSCMPTSHATPIHKGRAQVRPDTPLGKVLSLYGTPRPFAR